MMGTIKQQLARSAVQVKQLVYTHHVKAVLQKLGIHSAAFRVYNRILLASRPDEYTSEYKGASATFVINSKRQWIRASGGHFGSGDSPFLNELFASLRPDDVFYDIGANVGTIACIAADELPEGKVFAFEPLPDNARELRKNFRLNDIDGDVFAVALSDENGETEMLVDTQEDDPGSTNPISPERASSGFFRTRDDRVGVRMVRGDDLIEEEALPIPNVIKFDVEGAELKAINGMRETLAHKDCRVVHCEVHEYLLSDFGGTAEELEQTLKSRGFEIERYHERQHVAKLENGEQEERTLYRITAKKRPGNVSETLDE